MNKIQRTQKNREASPCTQETKIRPPKAEQGLQTKRMPINIRDLANVYNAAHLTSNSGNPLSPGNKYNSSVVLPGTSTTQEGIKSDVPHVMARVADYRLPGSTFVRGIHCLVRRRIVRDLRWLRVFLFYLYRNYRLGLVFFSYYEKIKLKIKMVSIISLKCMDYFNFNQRSATFIVEVHFLELNDFHGF